jgi:hypothetical protein
MFILFFLFSILILTNFFFFNLSIVLWNFEKKQTSDESKIQIEEKVTLPGNYI